MPSRVKSRAADTKNNCSGGFRQIPVPQIRHSQFSLEACLETVGLNRKVCVIPLCAFTLWISTSNFIRCQVGIQVGTKNCLSKILQWGGQTAAARDEKTNTVIHWAREMVR